MVTEAMHPLTLPRLLAWIRRERAATRTVFGLGEDLLRLDLSDHPAALDFHGQNVETPVGVAAGPHTQLSQNIVAAWLCGARVLELKTVQINPCLDIPRPCIDMTDEGYNCEWSQELSLDESFAQYADAWTAIRILQEEAGVLRPTESGFAMDMSVGYDLAGILSPGVQRFLDRMTRSRSEIETRLAAARAIFPGAAAVPVPESLSRSVTVSTMHGCPPEQIEQIARHLITERGLHTRIKLNPTLLGPDAVRELLVGRLGYAVEVPDEIFAEDLALDAAVDLVRSLQAAAHAAGVRFGVKLCNTLACRNTASHLPRSEETVYLSGRALHPVAVHVALELQEALGGDLDISFAGGVDAGNVARVAACDMLPATACSDLLRPGGIQRLLQYVDSLESAMTAIGAGDLNELVTATAGDTAQPAALVNLRAYAAEVAVDPAYQKATYPDRTIKTDRTLDPFDCVRAPCVHTCPTRQDIPEYLRSAAGGEFTRGLGVILRDNPFPTVTGMVCDAPCETRCTRVNLDAPVRIRDVKRFLAHRAAEPPAPARAAPNGRRAAVIGAGPAGLAFAHALALQGTQVTVHETKDFAGGMVTDAIPRFRLTDQDFRRDLQRIEALGVELRYGERIDRDRFDELCAASDAVFVGVGAQTDRRLGIPGDDLPGVWPALRFLAGARRRDLPPVGHDVAVIGGGNSAMDAARTAVRLVAAQGSVRLVYRRTVALMPAAREELAAILAEKVKVHELLTPARITRDQGRLVVSCRRMRLGEPDSSGRQRPEPLPGPTEDFAVDTVVVAAGQQRDTELLASLGLDAGAGGVRIGRALVHTGGDALRGPATLVEAIGDGRRAAHDVLREWRNGDAELEGAAPSPAQPTALAFWQQRAARREPPQKLCVRTPAGPGDFSLILGELTEAQARREAARCLECDRRCDVCVSVCPNRANLSYETRPVAWSLPEIRRTADGWETNDTGEEFRASQIPQTCHLVDLCNACGNCTTFCPTSGEPWQDKPRFTVKRDSEALAVGVHRLEKRGRELWIQRGTAMGTVELGRTAAGLVYETPTGSVGLDPASFAVRDVRFHAGTGDRIALRDAAGLAVLLDALAGGPLVVDVTEEG